MTFIDFAVKGKKVCVAHWDEIWNLKGYVDINY